MTNKQTGPSGLVERLRELLAKATPGPWEYRPDQYDDWGFIRGPEEQFSFGVTKPIVAISRGGSDADHDEHRRNKTDPYEPNGRLIVEAVNALPELLDRFASLSPVPVDEVERRELYIESDGDTPVAAVYRENRREVMRCTIRLTASRPSDDGEVGRD